MEETSLVKIETQGSHRAEMLGKSVQQYTDIGFCPYVLLLGPDYDAVEPVLLKWN